MKLQQKIKLYGNQTSIPLARCIIDPLHKLDCFDMESLMRLSKNGKEYIYVSRGLVNHNIANKDDPYICDRVQEMFNDEEYSLVFFLLRRFISTRSLGYGDQMLVLSDLEESLSALRISRGGSFLNRSSLFRKEDSASLFAFFNSSLCLWEESQELLPLFRSTLPGRLAFLAFF
ncbi:hypothetical protein VNO77_43600 [Canavalia gladiata]|uniref:Uncharacterized protein n=1 Tax=Canavalia gladiata TaxID=3824 RepID=A0AAN9PPK1_CANGL